jgi:hypothetical protein
LDTSWTLSTLLSLHMNRESERWLFSRFWRSTKWDSSSEEIRPSTERWQAFRAELDRLNVWCWQGGYPNSGVCDGTNWGARSCTPINRLSPVAAIAIQDVTEGRSRSPTNARIIPSNSFARQLRIWAEKSSRSLPTVDRLFEDQTM